MDDYRLRLTTYGAGYNAYSGRQQGGHTYAVIIAPDRSKHEIDRVLDAAGAAEFNRLDPDAGYRPGDLTGRFDYGSDAAAAAVEWMRANAPGSRLVDDAYWFTNGTSGEVIYEPSPVVTLDQVVDLTTNHRDEILAGMNEPSVIEVARRLADKADRDARQAAHDREMDQLFGPNFGRGGR